MTHKTAQLIAPFHPKQMGLAAAPDHESAKKFFPSGGWGHNWIGDPDAGLGKNQPGGWAYSLIFFMEGAACRSTRPLVCRWTRRRPRERQWWAPVLTRRGMKTPFRQFSIALVDGLTRSIPFRPRSAIREPVARIMDRLFHTLPGRQRGLCGQRRHHGFQQPQQPRQPGKRHAGRHARRIPRPSREHRCLPTLDATWYLVPYGPPAAGAPAQPISPAPADTTFTGVVWYRSEVKLRWITDGAGKVYLFGEKYHGYVQLHTSGFDGNGDEENLYVGMDDDNIRLGASAGVYTPVNAPDSLTPEQAGWVDVYGAFRYPPRQDAAIWPGRDTDGKRPAGVPVDKFNALRFGSAHPGAARTWPFAMARSAPSPTTSTPRFTRGSAIATTANRLIRRSLSANSRVASGAGAWLSGSNRRLPDTTARSRARPLRASSSGDDSRPPAAGSDRPR